MNPNPHKNPQPVHVPGTPKGEEMTLERGKEPGRGGPRSYREARDSTGINPKTQGPIHPDMPNIPPA
jgi:hypothetical protein